jgi:hypothetical protein
MNITTYDQWKLRSPEDEREPVATEPAVDRKEFRYAVSAVLADSLNAVATAEHTAAVEVRSLPMYPALPQKGRTARPSESSGYSFGSEG